MSSKKIKIDNTDFEWEKEISIKEQELSDIAWSDTLANISSVLNKKIEDANLFEPDDLPLVRVFKIFAKNIGDISVRALPEKNYEATKAGVQKLARDNTIRVREVVLREKWYKEDNGHLIGFYKKEGDIDISQENDTSENLIPVALIRNPNCSGYKIIEPSSGLEIPLTKKNAKQIYPVAIMAYKPLTEEKITIKTVCSFVLSDIKRDIVRYILIGLLCTLIGLITPFITRNFIIWVKRI